MPELPEVETIRRTLAPVLIGRRILAAELLRRDILIAPGDPPGGFSRQRASLRRGSASAPARIARPSRFEPADLLQGCTVTDILRRGKQLAIIAAPHRAAAPAPRAAAPRALVVQLGMTGALEALPANIPTPRAAVPHTHALWSLEPVRGKAAAIAFIDPRRFGGLRALPTLADLHTLWSALGPDALEIDGPPLWNALRTSRRAIKAALLDQAVLAGVGNIYADEALFRAGISPRTLAAKVRPARCSLLAAAVREVLAEAVAARGSTLRDYRDAAGLAGEFQARHAVYGRAGQPCTRCRGTLRSAAIGQRTTVWCPRCQR
ncbi:MAG: hypothetical protein KF699_16425 [Phycisphaeraceae bacterium]|nr:hypothetical protein [Phycisphaeraceae bacterium]